jgi:methionine sulfoxide reductase heme-binding subunit
MSTAVAASSSATLWYVVRASGVVALVLLTFDMVLGLLASARVRTAKWPAFAQVDLHKRVTLLALVFLGIHVLGAVVDSYVHVGWLSIVVPFTSTYQPYWTGLGAVAVDLLAAVAISSALRQRIRPELWRKLHWLAMACWPVALVHSLGDGTDAGRLWMIGITVVCTSAVAAALAWRIRCQRAASAVAAAVGATTRAVPVRPRQPVSGASNHHGAGHPREPRALHGTAARTLGQDPR